jgi:sensitive to high expression protein 9, mitochondrial
LLQRKSFWKEDDVSRFTTLVREDHVYEQEETHAKENLERADTSVEREFTMLMRSILDRYHEEQVWSDKIRSASTYGSLAALGLNLLVFIMAIVIVEPWKRRRLAQTFERKVEEMGSQTRAMFETGMKELEDHLEEQEKRLVQVAAATLAASQPEAPPLLDPPVLERIEDEEPLKTPPRSMRNLPPTLDYPLLATGFVAAVVGWTARSFWSR